MKTIDDVRSKFKVLSSGGHAPPNSHCAACIMEARAWALERVWKDSSPDDCEVAQSFSRTLNDAEWSSDQARTDAMLQFVLHAGMAKQSKATTQKRAFIAADWAVRRFAPTALRAAKMEAEAKKLEAIAPIKDKATAAAAGDAAWNAAGAAARAARAAMAAMAAIAAGDAAWNAAEAAARAAMAAMAAIAAGDAAWNAAEDAARAARAAMAAIAAGDAAWNAAEDAVDDILRMGTECLLAIVSCVDDSP